MRKSTLNPPILLSDGKRMRQVWRPEDEDGDSSTYIVERSINNIRGHPTWKLFMGEVPLPIKRGSKEEPPRYVYLDDKACHAIHSADIYSKEELNLFWPFDFNHFGHIRAGRKNRGRPAYADDSETSYATAPLRSKKDSYRFTGSPDMTTEYEPVRPKKPTRIEAEVAEEFALKAERLKEQRIMQRMAREDRWKMHHGDTPFVEDPTLEPYVLLTPDMDSNSGPSPGILEEDVIDSGQKTDNLSAPAPGNSSSPTQRSPVPDTSSAKSSTPPRKLKPRLGTFKLKPSLTENASEHGQPTASSSILRRSISAVNPGESSPKRRLPAQTNSLPRRPTFGGDGSNDDDFQVWQPRPPPLPGMEAYGSEESSQSRFNDELAQAHASHVSGVDTIPRIGFRNHVQQGGIDEDVHGHALFNCANTIDEQKAFDSTGIPELREVDHSQDDVKMESAAEDTHKRAAQDEFNSGPVKEDKDDVPIGKNGETQFSDERIRNHEDSQDQGNGFDNSELDRKHQQEYEHGQFTNLEQSQLCNEQQQEHEQYPVPKDEGINDSGMESNPPKTEQHDGASRESLEIVRLATRLKAAEQESEQFKRNLQQVYEEWTHFNLEVQVMEQEKQQLAAALEQVSKEKDNLSSGAIALENNLGTHKEHITQLARENGILNSQVLSYGNERNQLIQRNTTLENALQACSQENQQLKNQIISSNHEYGQAQKSNKQSQKEKQQLTKSYTALETRFQAEVQAKNQLTQANATVNAELQASEQRNSKLQVDHECMTIHTAFIDKKLSHYQSVITMLLATNITHEKEFRARIAALQDFANQALALTVTGQKLGLVAKEQIQPTMKLCDGLGTVLDAPGKYMYEAGLDEEWREMQDEATKRVEGEGGVDGGRKRKWAFS